jgi:hypothetical protein
MAQGGAAGGEEAVEQPACCQQKQEQLDTAGCQPGQERTLQGTDQQQRQQPCLEAAFPLSPPPLCGLQVDAGDCGSSSDGESVCGVCYDSPATAVVLRACSHRLCVDCLRGVIASQSPGPSPPSCPFCRGRITGFELHL